MLCFARYGLGQRQQPYSELSMDVSVPFLLSTFCVIVVVDIVTELVWEGVRSEIMLYADDFILMNEKIEGLRNIFIDIAGTSNRFRKWKAFESICLNVNIWKTKLMVSRVINKDGFSCVKLINVGFAVLG